MGVFMANPLALRWGPLSLLMDLDSGACKQLRWTERDNDNPVDLLAWHQPQPIHKPFEVGSFVLVPYSNRLFGGQLLSPNGTFTLPGNHPESDTPVHGLGWRKNWQLIVREPQRVVLGYSHASDAHWRFSHTCEQTVTLNHSEVMFHLKLCNIDAQPMPAGLGFHPWFALDEDSTVWTTPTILISLDEKESGLTPDELVDRLRTGDPPILTRAFQGKLLIDPHNLRGDEASIVARRLREECSKIAAPIPA